MSSPAITYAPELLPDELLYSWLARVVALNTMGAPRDVLDLLFGCRTLVPSVDLPTRLLAVERRLGGWLPFATADELLEGGTLMPYHRPFLTVESYSRVRHSLLNGNGKGLKTSMGRVANRFGAHPALRSCPSCLVDSWSRYGSLYWMRKHQLPGVNCCTTHGVSLQGTPLHARTHRQRLLLPTATSGTQRAVLADARQLRFAQLSQDLVEGALPAIAAAQRTATYREAALALGYGTRRGRVAFGELADALRHRFDDFEGFDHQGRLLSSNTQPLGWLRPLFDKPQRSLHPICHLLLIEFLFGSMTAFKDALAACDLDSCAQASDGLLLAQGAKAPGVADATLPERVIDREDMLCDPSLSCREVAARLGKSVTTVVAWRRARAIPIRERRKSLHPTVIDQVLKAIGSLWSLPAVAARTGVSLSSVYRILAQYPATPRPSWSRAGVEQGPLRRARWVAALQACRYKGFSLISAARASAGADYTWLYRHDRVWLAASTSKLGLPTKHHNYGVSRVDWGRRDAELCQLLQQQLGVLRAEVPTQRLTKTRLMRLLGETMVGRNLGRLPGLNALLDKVVESPLTFSKRRVDQAIAILVRDGVQLQLWRIQRLAGLRSWSNALHAYAGQQVGRLDAQNSLRPRGIS